MLWQPKTENSPKEAEPDVKNKYIAVKGKTKRGLLSQISLTGGRLNKLSPYLSLTFYSLAVTIDPSEYFFTQPSQIGLCLDTLWLLENCG